METRFTILLFEVGIAVAMQIAMLVAIFAVLKKSTARLELLASEFQQRALPTLDNVQTLVNTIRPRLETISENLAESTTVLRNQVHKLDATISDVADRTRLQVVRADEMVTRALDRFEVTTEAVQQTVISPVRMLAGLAQGLSAGLSVLFGRRGNSGNGMRAHQHDEMFI